MNISQSWTVPPWDPPNDMTVMLRDGDEYFRGLPGEALKAAARTHTIRIHIIGFESSITFPPAAMDIGIIGASNELAMKSMISREHPAVIHLVLIHVAQQIDDKTFTALENVVLITVGEGGRHLSLHDAELTLFLKVITAHALPDFRTEEVLRSAKGFFDGGPFTVPGTKRIIAAARTRQVMIHVIHDATSNDDEVKPALRDLKALGLAGGEDEWHAIYMMRWNSRRTHVVWAPEAQLATFDDIAKELDVLRVNLSIHKNELDMFLSKIAVHATYPIFEPAAPYG